MLEYLLKNGAQADKPEKDYGTPITASSNNGHTEVANLLRLHLETMEVSKTENIDDLFQIPNSTFVL